MRFDSFGVVRVSLCVLNKKIQGLKKDLARYTVGSVRRCDQQDLGDAYMINVCAVDAQIPRFQNLQHVVVLQTAMIGGAASIRNSLS